MLLLPRFLPFPLIKSLSKVYINEKCVIKVGISCSFAGHTCFLGGFYVSYTEYSDVRPVSLSPPPKRPSLLWLAWEKIYGASLQKVVFKPWAEIVLDSVPIPERYDNNLVIRSIPPLISTSFLSLTVKLNILMVYGYERDWNQIFRIRMKCDRLAAHTPAWSLKIALAPIWFYRRERLASILLTVDVI